MINIGIRADGSVSIGMGHIMRCLSLAKGFRNGGCQVYFISKYKEGIARIREEDFEVVKLGDYDFTSPAVGFFYGDEAELQKETDEIISCIKKYSIDLMFIDSYNVNQEYFLNLKPFLKKLCYIDDVNRFVYPVDVLINGNITGETLCYEKYCQDEVLLLGLRYNFIRSEFKGLPKREVNEEVREIMITVGGADPYDLSTRLASFILSDKELKKLKTNIVVGDGFNNKEKLRILSKDNKNIILHENVSRMSNIMLNCDLAISAGGSTLYELCACGTPTLAVIVADNQQDIVKTLSDRGYIECLGWYNDLSDTKLDNKIKSFCNDYYKRKSTAEKMQKLVDGEGVKRVVQEIMKLL